MSRLSRLNYHEVARQHAFFNPIVQKDIGRSFIFNFHSFYSKKGWETYFEEDVGEIM